MRNFERLALPALAVAAFIAATPVQASTLIADGITYSLTATSLNATTNEFTLLITGINAAADIEKGRSGVNGIAFSLPNHFESAVMINPPSIFTEQGGGLNSSGCNGNGNFFCFKANTTPTSLPEFAADSSLTFVFDVRSHRAPLRGIAPTSRSIGLDRKITTISYQRSLIRHLPKRQFRVRYHSSQAAAGFWVS